MRYIKKILFSESVDFTTQYRIERQSSHQCDFRLIKIGDYDEVHKRILLDDSVDITAQYRYEH